MRWFPSSTSPSRSGLPKQKTPSGFPAGGIGSFRLELVEKVQSDGDYILFPTGRGGGTAKGSVAIQAMVPTCLKSADNVRPQGIVKRPCQAEQFLVVTGARCIPEAIGGAGVFSAAIEL